MQKIFPFGLTAGSPVTTAVTVSSGILKQEHRLDNASAVVSAVPFWRGASRFGSHHLAFTAGVTEAVDSIVVVLDAVIVIVPRTESPVTRTVLRSCQ